MPFKQSIGVDHGVQVQEVHKARVFAVEVQPAQEKAGEAKPWKEHNVGFLNRWRQMGIIDISEVGKVLMAALVFHLEQVLPWRCRILEVHHEVHVVEYFLDKLLYIRGHVNIQRDGRAVAFLVDKVWEAIPGAKR